MTTDAGEWDDDVVDITGFEEIAPVDDGPQTVYANVAEFSTST